MTEAELRARIDEVEADRKRLVDEAQQINEQYPGDDMPAGMVTRMERLVAGASKRRDEADELRLQLAAAAGARGAQIEEIRALHALGGHATVAGSDPGPAGFYTNTAGSPFSTDRALELDVDAVRARAITAAEKAPNMPDAVRQSMTAMAESGGQDDVDATALNRWLVAASDPDYSRGFFKLMADPTFGFASLTDPERAAWQRARHVEGEMRAMSGGSDTSGGYGTPIVIDPSIWLTSQMSLNPMRRISRQVATVSDVWKGVSSAGVSFSWDSEASEVSDDSPTLAQPSITVHSGRGFVPYSIEVGMDYPGLAQELGNLLAEGYNELEAAAFINGSGSGAPYGVITRLDADTNVEVVVGTDGAFTSPDVKKVWTELPDRWKANATWLMSHDVGAEIASFDTTGGLSQQTVSMVDTVEKLRSRPVEYASHMPSFIGTTGASNILVVGDFRNYVVVDRLPGLTVELVPHVFGLTNNRPLGQRGFFAWRRVGADVILNDGFRLLQNQ